MLVADNWNSEKGKQMELLVDVFVAMSNDHFESRYLFLIKGILNPGWTHLSNKSCVEFQECFNYLIISISDCKV